MSELNNNDDSGIVATNLVDKMIKFESDHRPFINLFIRPIFMVIVFLSVGYYTLWLSTNYVKQDRFNTYLEKQIESDKTQDETAKARFEIVQTKLETIINQQISYTEQLKAYNQILSTMQKQIDSMDQRLMYLERRRLDNNNQ